MAGRQGQLSNRDPCGVRRCPTSFPQPSFRPAGILSRCSRRGLVCADGLRCDQRIKRADRSAGFFKLGADSDIRDSVFGCEFDARDGVQKVLGLEPATFGLEVPDTKNEVLTPVVPAKLARNTKSFVDNTKPLVVASRTRTTKADERQDPPAHRRRAGDLAPGE